MKPTKPSPKDQRSDVKNPNNPAFGKDQENRRAQEQQPRRIQEQETEHRRVQPQEQEPRRMQEEEQQQRRMQEQEPEQRRMMEQDQEDETRRTHPNYDGGIKREDFPEGKPQGFPAEKLGPSHRQS